MKKQLLNYLLLLTAVVFADRVKASHIMGSEITYTCQGGGLYEVTVKVYRDCNGVLIDRSPLLAHSDSGTISVDTQSQTLVSVRDITNIGPNCGIQSRCASSSYQYGYEEYVWTMTLDLNQYGSCEWILSWEQCCRNSAITTGPANQNFYTTAMLNKCISPCNNSPVFTNSPAPIAIVCHNQDLVFNNGAMDTVDGIDSLSYEWDSALQASNQSVTYSGSFKYYCPLTFFGFPNANLQWPAGITIDEITGTVMFRPIQQNQVAVLVVKVKEWRKINGQMQVIGWVRRDIQVIVLPCPNNKTPKILPPYSVQTCAGQTICMDIKTDDDDTGDTVRISWNNAMPGATFTHNSGAVKHAEGQVCWTPTEADISNIPYTFYITARDNACPMQGQSVRAFSIFVRGAKAALSVDTLNCMEVVVDNTPMSGSQNYNSFYQIRDSSGQVVWTSQNKKDTAALAGGKYIVQLTTSTSIGCGISVYDTVVLSGNGLVGKTKNVDICQGDSLKLSPAHPGPLNYSWYEVSVPGQNTSLGSGVSFSVLPTKNTTYLAIAGSGCVLMDTTRVSTLPKPVAWFWSQPDTTCLREAGFTFMDGSTISSGSIVHRNWDFGNGSYDTTVSPMMVYTDTGVFEVGLEVVSDLGCSDRFTQLVGVLPNPQLQQVADQVQLAKGATATFDVGNVHSNALYQWQLDQGSGFADLSDGGPFSGTLTHQLSFSNVDSSHSGFVFRCIVRLGNCIDTSNSATLTVQNPLGTGSINGTGLYSVYPNPAGTVLYIEAPQATTPLSYRIFDAYGRELMRGVIQDGISVADVSKLSNGVYYVILEIEPMHPLRFLKVD